ncbi:MAG: EpsG family protein [Fibrobacter sp.]|nr:EpsG family protein [Fibrobacter sp.]MDY6389273.1 EpsG family protein [Fibrobacter sp.]
MFAAVFCILIFVGFFAKDKMRLFGLTSVLFLSVLCYGVDDPDLQNYKRAYDSIAAGNDYTDLGVIWLGLCKFFSSCGFDYYMYKSVIVLVSGFFILQLINHYVKNPKYASFVWVCYLIFPAVMDLVQLRFFLASSIAIWSTQFLIDKAKYGKGKFIILMLLASMIHSSVFFYFSFLLFPFFEGKEKKFAYLVVVCFVLFFFLKSKLLSVANVLTNANRIERYFEGGGAVGSFGILAYTGTILAFYFLAKGMKKSAGAVEANYYSFFQKAVLVSSFLLPLTLFDTNFFRIQRPMWLMLYIGAAMLLDRGTRTIYVGSKKRINCKQSIAFFAVMGFVFYVSIFNFNVIECYFIR